MLNTPPVATNLPELCEVPRWSDRLFLPHGLQGYFDYEQGLECAQKQNKPALLVFKGHACANCKKMEANVWSDPAVLQVLRNDLIIIALYTDDRSPLPEQEWVTSLYDGKTKKTMGQKNADIQISRFGSNTQPFYVLIDTEGNPTERTLGYTSDQTVFLEFLQQDIPTP